MSWKAKARPSVKVSKETEAGQRAEVFHEKQTAAELQATTPSWPCLMAARRCQRVTT